MNILSLHSFQLSLCEKGLAGRAGSQVVRAHATYAADPGSLSHFKNLSTV